MPGIFAFLPILCIFAHHMKPAIIEDILLQTPRLTTATTLGGQRVSAGFKGIVIHNGKKVVKR